MSLNISRKKIIALVIGAIAIGTVTISYLHHVRKPAVVVIPIQPAPPTVVVPAKPVAAPYISIKGTVYHTIKIATTDPATELASLVGDANVQTVLEINRIDMADLVTGKVLIVPNSFDDVASLSPFPATLAIATDIPKLMVVSLQMQAFAIYDSGVLVRWGGVNTGKQSTPTPSQLYFANWKGKSVVSTEDDSWILPWYVNLDNANGVSMHQYALPGYPASHACVRLFEQDAEWIYNWVDQWKVSDDGETVLAHGTPVLVFGQYGYGKTAPWKNLVKNPLATTISSDTLEKIVASYKTQITTSL